MTWLEAGQLSPCQCLRCFGLFVFVVRSTMGIYSAILAAPIEMEHMS